MVSFLLWREEFTVATIITIATTESLHDRHFIQSVGGIPWDVGGRVNPAFIVRETQVSIPALSLNLLSFCFLPGEAETRP